VYVSRRWIDLRFVALKRRPPVSGGVQLSIEGGWPASDGGATGSFLGVSCASSSGLEPYYSSSESYWSSPASTKDRKSQ